MAAGLILAMSFAASAANTTKVITGEYTVSNAEYSGSYSDSVFKITGDGNYTVTFENVRFHNMYDAVDGNCVYISHNSGTVNVNFINCMFESCGHSEYCGGAIYVGGVGTTAVNFSNCIIDDCYGEYGGFLYVDNTNASINGNGTTICYGCVAHEDGGAIYMKSARIVNGFTFSSNTAYEDGGAIANACDDEDYGRIMDCRFFSNHANSEGGAEAAGIGTGKGVYSVCSEVTIKGGSVPLHPYRAACAGQTALRRMRGANRERGRVKTTATMSRG